MVIQRPFYLNQLIERMQNGQIKIVTGVRRCGKSFLLFNLFEGHLRISGVENDAIISVALDDIRFEELRNPKKLFKYIQDRIQDPSKHYYVLLDEIQYAISRAELRNPDQPIGLYSVLNGLQRLQNVDIYVTGSNSKLLSRDIATGFRGRGDVIEMHPLTFKEFYQAFPGDVVQQFEAFALYGGLPFVWMRPSDEAKRSYLITLFKEVYYKDIEERYTIETPSVLNELTDVLCSSIGSLTNPTKILNTLRSVRQLKTSHETIVRYLDCLTDSFLFKCAKRYDIKGRKYFQSPLKYYCEDVGLRNARLNFRQQEETHIMENIIYNELIARGYAVDVGIVTGNQVAAEGKRVRRTYEIDFVVNSSPQRYYIQSALRLDSPEKQAQEQRPLNLIHDGFKRIIITKSTQKPWIDEQGILYLGLYDFLLNEKSLSI